MKESVIRKDNANSIIQDEEMMKTLEEMKNLNKSSKMD